MTPADEDQNYLICSFLRINTTFFSELRFSLVYSHILMCEEEEDNHTITIAITFNTPFGKN